MCFEDQHVTHFTTGLGFSGTKPVFCVQNGINLDKPVFPVQIWENFSKVGKMTENYISSSTEESFQKWDVANKNGTGQMATEVYGTISQEVMSS